MRPESVKTVFEGRQIRLVLERWGNDEREVVEHPGAVTVVAVDDQDRITLVR